MQTDFAPYPPIDYLAVGHVCRDVTPGGYITGGSVAYSTAVAQALGCRSGIVTSSAPRDVFEEVSPSISIHHVDSPATTVFENIYTTTGRTQIIHAVAGDLTVGHIPPLWSRAPMVHLGPIANEVDPSIIHLFSNSMVCVVPQGWMRRWDEKGRVYRVEWEDADEILPLAAVSILSVEDLPDSSMIEDFAELARLLVVTDGPNGCTVYWNNEVRAFPAPTVKAVDLTGAGDVFAAAYLVRLFQTGGDAWDAAEFANRVAACSVTRSGLLGKATAIRRLLAEETRQEAEEN